MRTYDENAIRSDFENLQPELSSWGEHVDHVLNDFLAKTFPSPEHIQQKARHRVKAIESYCEKVLKRKAYNNPLLETTDKVGTRVILLTTEDVRKVSEYIPQCGQWIFVERSHDSLSEILTNPEMFTYQSEHFIVKPSDDYPTKADKNLLTCEIQIRTILQHAYAEISHDTIYKKTLDDSARIKRMLASSMAFIEAADEKFNQIYAAMSSLDTPGMRLQQLLVSLYEECDSAYQSDSYRTDIANMLLSIFTEDDRKTMETELKDFFNAEKEMILSAIHAYKGQSVLFRHPVVLVAFYGIIHHQQKLWKEWPFSYEDFERVVHGMNLSMESFR